MLGRLGRVEFGISLGLTPDTIMDLDWLARRKAFVALPETILSWEGIVYIWSKLVVVVVHKEECCGCLHRGFSSIIRMSSSGKNKIVERVTSSAYTGFRPADEYTWMSAFLWSSLSNNPNPGWTPFCCLLVYMGAQCHFVQACLTSHRGSRTANPQLRWMRSDLLGIDGFRFTYDPNRGRNEYV